MDVLLEDIRSKFDLVLEGHEVLRGEIRELGHKTEERFDLVDFKIDTLNQKIEAVCSELKEEIASVSSELKAEIRAVDANLSEHRRDTEAHRGVWQVRED